MDQPLRVILEVGPKRRVVAAAIDWPGLDRWATSEDAAIEKLLVYRQRYVAVAEHAGLADELAAQTEPEVIERVTGSSSTDYWGIAHVPSETEREAPDPEALERSLGLLAATWATFDRVAARVPVELRAGPRGGGWTRDEIVRHVLANEPAQFSRKVEVRTPKEVVLTPEGLAAHRAAYLDALREYVAAGRPARTWPIRFLIRRTAHHVMDHTWEMEDRDPDA